MQWQLDHAVEQRAGVDDVTFVAAVFSMVALEG